VLIATLAQSAACNRSHEIRARMARWLLMTHDRVDSDEFPLTQEFLGQMLGVRRPAVSGAGAALQHDGIIKYSRGKITVVDRARLERASCECYERVQREFARYFPER
jgi:CRP-like cAMP-binding protein